MLNNVPSLKKIDFKNIKSNADRYLGSLGLTFMYAFGFRTSIFNLPALIILFFSINSLIKSMYLQKIQILSLEEIRDFEYSIIISQSSDDDLLSSIKYYLDHYKKDTLLYEAIENLHLTLSNNGCLEKEIQTIDISRELRSFLKVLSYTLSSGMDIKKVTILEYEALIKRIEAEKEIWASFADKRLEVMLMILMPPLIVYISKLGLSSNLRSADIFETIVTFITIILISLSSKIIEIIIGEEK